MEIKKVGVLGCGLMGSGIAQVAASPVGLIEILVGGDVVERRAVEVSTARHEQRQRGSERSTRAVTGAPPGRPLCQ